ncbi:MAG: penicillin-binding transpeptidase domain-containing protein [Candidatus Campbellbacteria bacterium]|nr:penicillin-binding transpeptidase domain-containing protein [Candidatus Campbellbacteria bacterium]
MKRKNKNNFQIDPHEVLLDSESLEDQSESDSRLEKPIRTSSLQILILITVAIFAIFSFKLFNLQIVEGKEYKERSENNRLQHSLIPAERGIIYDRNGEKLAWNEKSSNGSDHAKRQYTELGGMGHILGYTKPPAKDKSGIYYRTHHIGLAGAESVFERQLRGNNGTRIIETNVKYEVVSKNLIKEPEPGGEVELSIDAEISNKLYEEIKSATEEYGFRGGSAVIMDIDSGEILALSNYPETDSNVLSDGKNEEEIEKYSENPAKPYLNRALNGSFTPGSIVKPFIATAALNENIINPNKTIFSDGSIQIESPYDPEDVYVFRDWQAHGAVDMREALAVSSNEYFYTIGGGHEDQEGLGIDRIYEYMHLFGFGEKTGIELGSEAVGVVPSREWKRETFESESWFLGDTYNTSIGQYGFLVTPIQAVRATAAIANGGTLLTPRISDSLLLEKKELDIAEKDLQVVREGMRLGVTDKIVRSLKFPELSIAAKTGTAEVGFEKGYENSWVVGYFPYDEPKYAFAVLLDHVDESNSFGAAPNMRSFFQWLIKEKPEYTTTGSD